MSKALDQLIQTVQALRDPVSGCPWDIKQTHESLRKHLIEESYEVIQAINNQDQINLKEELGDVLLQVLLHSQIAEEAKIFDLESVINELNSKLIRRHPHVFEDQKAANADAALSIWEAQKLKEKGNTKQTDFAKNVPKDLPTLMRAEKIGKESGKINFDWPNSEAALGKVEEEFAELLDALKGTGSAAKKQIEEELGDLLFSLSQLARKLDISAEISLESANQKFIGRINKILEVRTAAELQSLSDQEKLNLWKSLKKS